MAWESKFFSVNQSRDWQRGRLENITVQGNRMLISTSATYSVEKRVDLQRHLSGRVLRGAAALATRLYLLTDAADIWMIDPFTTYAEPVFPLGQQLFSLESQLTTLPNLLIVSDPAQGVRAYSVMNRQPIWDFRFHRNRPTQPLCVGSDHHQYVYALCREDGVDDGSNAYLLVKISENGRVVASADVTMEVPDGNVPLRLVAGPDLVCLLVSGSQPQIMLFSDDLTPTLQFSPDMDGNHLVDVFFDPSGQLIAIATDALGTSVLIPLRGDSASQSITPDVALEGTVSHAITDGPESLLTLDGDAQRLVVFRYRPSHERNPRTGVYEGTLITHAFDSLESGTRWHKVSLTADVPEECQLEVRYFASDSPMALSGGTLITVDDVIADETMDETTRAHWLYPLFSDHVIAAPDALIQAEGRYLWLMVRMVGRRTASPVVKRLRVYYPRASYLDFLPAVYQEDGPSRDFLERFLAIFNTLSSNLDERIDTVSRLFDPHTAPEEMLPWLATWLGFTPDETWESDQLRTLVQELPDLNRCRGTRGGIERIVQLYTGQIPLIVEYPQYESFMGRVEFRDLMSRLYGGNPNSFAVLVNGDSAPDARRRYVLSKLIERQKPAFTEAKLVILSPWIYMDMHAYLGINTYLSEAKSFHLDGKSVLPHDTIIIDVGAWVTNYGGQS